MYKNLLLFLILLGFVVMSFGARADDSTPPGASAFSLTPAEINTEEADQLVTLTVSLTDDLSGVCTSEDCGDSYHGGPCQVRLVSASGSGQFVDFWNLIRVSGTKHSGDYSSTVLLPKGSATGIWQVESLLSKIGIKENALQVNCGVRFLRQQKTT